MTFPQLRVLFPTNFSTACLHAGRTIEQLGEGCLLRLTLVHVMKKGTKARRAQIALDGFLADMDERCLVDRILLEGDDPATLVADLCKRRSFDLMMAPRSSQPDLTSLFRSSFRARLLRQCTVPLWTGGDRVASDRLGRPPRTVACLVDFDDAPAGLVHIASAFAERFGARLRVISVLPSIDDGTIADVLTSDAPLATADAFSRIQQIFDGRTLPEVDLVVGTPAHGLRRLMRRANADLLFVGTRRACGSRWFTRFARVLDRLPCPVVCADGAADPLPNWVISPSRVFPRAATVSGVAVAG